MAGSSLRFCAQCMGSQATAAQDRCRTCGGLLQPLLDENGAMSREFLSARGTCCSNGCRNCPYPSEMTEKICERCGAPFGCSGTNCWCAQMRISPSGLKWLQQSYGDCLCPACLELFSVG